MKQLIQTPLTTPERRPMKYRTSTIAFAILIGFLTLTGATNHTNGTSAEALRTIKNEAFTYGEKLTFAVKYKFVTAGYATMSVGSSPVTVSDRSCYDIQFKVRTTNSFDRIFKVRDVYRTWVDVEGLFPWKFQQRVREGDYSKDFSANIDQKAHLARTTQGSFKVPEFVQDVLSAFYYTRVVNLKGMKTGQSFSVKNFYGKKTHTLKVRVLGRETVSVKAGKFKCIKLEPLVTEGGLFKSEGKIYLWVTDDDRKMPVKVSTAVVIGSIDSELVKYEGLNGKLSAKVN